MNANIRPYLSHYQDRHDKTRWRFRRDGKTVSLKGEPGEPEFEEAYSALLEGREPRRAAVVKLPGGVVPQSFADAWKRTVRAHEWKALDPKTQAQDIFLAERFLAMPVVEGADVSWGEMPVKDLKLRHLKDIVARFSDRPHAGKHTVKVVRKMIAAAMDEEWVEFDVSLGLKHRPGYKGFRAWTDDELVAFEARWPVGTAARTAYALAAWLGTRRSDIARLRWDQLDFRRGIVTLETVKGEKTLTLPITKFLAEALEPLPRAGECVLLTVYGAPFSEKSLTGRMADWTRSAGIGKGATLHGLRKTLGKTAAEAGASTRELMDVLGHSNIAHAELYSREAAQAVLAKSAMAKVTRLVTKKRRG